MLVYPVWGGRAIFALGLVVREKVIMILGAAKSVDPQNNKGVMSNLNFFQTYSQKENHVTNNTLLMLRHVYRVSPDLFEKFLHGLLEDDSLEVGVTFSQQTVLPLKTTTKKSVPDGVISQEPFSVFIEAKTVGSLNKSQIVSHAEALSGNKIQNGHLIGLTVGAADESLAEDLRQACDKHGVQFHWCTYQQVCDNLSGRCGEHPELAEIVEDYVDFINKNDLLPTRHHTMVALLSGRSHQDNARFGICYELASRPAKWRRAEYVGVYTNKAIRHVGRLSSVVVARLGEGAGQYSSDRLQISDHEYGSDTLSEEAKKQLLEAIEAADTLYGYVSQVDHRYYITEKMVETNFSKDSSGGLWGHRYFDIGKYFEKPSALSSMNIEDIAKGLNGRKFD